MNKLEDIFTSLHNAVLEAQKLTEQQHVRQIRRYFEPADSETGPIPKMVPFKIPDMRTDSEEEFRMIEVPLIALSPSTSLKIKDLHINFQVQINGLGKRGKGTDPVTGKSKEHAGDVEMEFGKTGTNLATIDITFDQAATPESIHRLTDLLSKSLPWS